MNYFEINYKPKSLISYANRRWSQGDLYKKLGFSLENKTVPNFFYFKLKDLKYDFFELESRDKYQKYKLESYVKEGKLKFFDKKLSGHFNMFKNNYRRIWDSGNLTYSKVYY